MEIFNHNPDESLEEIYSIYMEFCPYRKRILFDRSDLFDFAYHLEILISHQEEKFKFFLDFLESQKYVLPLCIKFESNLSKNLTLSLRNDFDKNNNKIKYYHPIQFFQIIYLYHDFIQRDVFSDKIYQKFESLKYLEMDYYNKKNYPVKKKDRKSRVSIYSAKIKLIEESINRIRRIFQGYINNIRAFPTTKEKDTQLINKNIQDFKEKIENSNFSLSSSMMCSNSTIWLTNSFFKLWIKFESLLIDGYCFFYSPFLDFEITPFKDNLPLIVNFKVTDLTENTKKYRQWRDKIIENPHQKFSPEEIKLSKSMVWYFRHNYWNIKQSGTFPFPIIEILEPYVLDKIKGFNFYNINILSIKRYLIRTFWELFKENHSTDIPSKDDPFLHLRSKENWLGYNKKVLENFTVSYKEINKDFQKKSNYLNQELIESKKNKEMNSQKYREHNNALIKKINDLQITFREEKINNVKIWETLKFFTEREEIENHEIIQNIFLQVVHRACKNYYYTLDRIRSDITKEIKKNLPTTCKNIILCISDKAWDKSQPFYAKNSHYSLKTFKGYRTKLMKLSHIKKNLQSFDFNSTFFYLVDDFLGSGKSTSDWFNAQFFQQNPQSEKYNLFFQNLHLIYGVGYNDSKGLLSKNLKIQENQIYICNPLFPQDQAFFEENWENQKENLNLFLEFFKQNDPNYYNGFPKSPEKGLELLVIFDSYIPNNTIGCLWKSFKYGKQKWIPLFPRY